MKQETKDNIIEAIEKGFDVATSIGMVLIGLFWMVLILGAFFGSMVTKAHAQVEAPNADVFGRAGVAAIGCYKENGATQCTDDALITCYHNDIERNIANYGATIAAFCLNEDLSFAQREKGARENKRNRIEIARLKKLLNARGCRR